MKWIKAEERLPRFCEDILFTDGKKVYRGWLETLEPEEDPVFYNNSHRAMYSFEEPSTPEGVTHWMPLPTPPT